MVPVLVPRYWSKSEKTFVFDAQARTEVRGGVFEGLYAVGTPAAGLEGGPSRRANTNPEDG
jgi:hypothetical protein